MRFMQSWIRSNRRIFARTYLFRHPPVRREYSTGKVKSSKVLEEALWAAGSVAVTIPSCWFLLSGREDHKSLIKDHHDSQEHSDSNSDKQTEEKNSEESEELFLEYTGKNEEGFESDEKQKDFQDNNRSIATYECTSCEENAGDVNHKASNSDSASDQYERHDDSSISDAGKPVNASGEEDNSKMAE